MKRIAKLLVCLGLAWGMNAQASTLSFFCITPSVSTDCGIGQSQLTVDVIGTTKGVSFTFYNKVGSKSSITDVYFDAGTSSLSGSPLPTITDSDVGNQTNVVFSLDANPANLPGANNITPPFNASTSTAFTSGANAGNGGTTSHGVNAASEWLTLDYALKSGKTLNDVLLDLSNGNLRLGIHVTGFQDGNSASFVNNPGLPPQVVPVPAAAWLLGSGLIGLVGLARRRVIQ
ncbi:VPLPA-CTERM sorting domain-containing protein [Sulfurirhabdus autotrophica]|uniref:Putative secreted protein n=1 Tax=Sulfurirhabdus autotrophica TaxID=1706046 RepID=A0A4R3YEU7_9PROT|nr:VPLPA-CTERM sorting domain-containing protein [Sulfurirhabdus autotrophica]TCV88993.1 putative secreted protein [Sulfurirhabdus autotrophica]